MTAPLVWLALAGPLWGVIGSTVLPRRYRRLGKDHHRAELVGALGGLALGPLLLIPVLALTPDLRRRAYPVALGALLAAELVALLKVLAPNDPCLTSSGYVLDQAQNGLTLGAVYATMAVGLTLIFSVLGIVSFSHGQFVMLGGIASYLLLSRLPVNPLAVVPVAGLLGLLLGAGVDRALLSPMHKGRVDRPDEYAILITFGLGIFLEYALLGVLGPISGISAPRYTDRPLLGLSAAGATAGPLHLRTDFIVAGIAGLLLIGLVYWFLDRTWAGRSLRAVALNRSAASVAGIDSRGAYTLAFGTGAALACMAGAILVPVLEFTIPDTADMASVTSYVIVVLGGLGSIRGALLGGLTIGAMESLGAACYPDPSRGAVYQTAFGLLVFAAVLLLRPQGMFGRKG